MPVRPWRSVSTAVPAASQLTLLATPERIRFTSPPCRRPVWTALAVASSVIMFGFGTLHCALVTRRDYPADSHSPMPGHISTVDLQLEIGWGINGAIALIAACALIGASWRSRWTWFELEVTRDTWSAALVRPRRGGCCWERSSESGPTSDLRGAKVGPHALPVHDGPAPAVPSAHLALLERISTACDRCTHLARRSLPRLAPAGITARSSL